MIAQAPQPPPASRRRRRYHFHTPGLLYVVVTFFIAVGAINSQNNLLFASLGLAIGGLLMSGILSGGSLMGIRCDRGVVNGGRGASVGRPLRFVYRVTNVNKLLPAFGLIVVEHPDKAGHSNWPGFIATPRAFAPHVAGKSSVEVVTEVVPRCRGLMRLDVVRISTTFPFGLARKSISFGLPMSVVVHPVELPVSPGILKKLAVRASSGTGAAMSPGLGDEFYGLREYSDGDSPRWIAWRRSARTGQMVVRQNTTPTPRQLWLIVDIPPENADRGLVERAIAIAASLIRAASRAGAAVGLAVPRAGITVHPQASGRAVRAMLDRLAMLDVSQLGARGDFPENVVRSAASAVIHAGGIERGIGGSRSIHISAADPGNILLQGDGLNKALALLDEPFTKERSSPSLAARVREYVGLEGHG